MLWLHPLSSCYRVKKGFSVTRRTKLALLHDPNLHPDLQFSIFSMPCRLLAQKMLLLFPIVKGVNLQIAKEKNAVGNVAGSYPHSIHTTSSLSFIHVSPFLFVSETQTRAFSSWSQEASSRTHPSALPTFCYRERAWVDKWLESSSATARSPSTEMS